MWICPVCKQQEYMGLTCSNCGCHKGWVFHSCLNHVAAPGTPVLVNREYRSVILGHSVIGCTLYYILWRPEHKLILGEEYMVISSTRLEPIS